MEFTAIVPSQPLDLIEPNERRPQWRTARRCNFFVGTTEWEREPRIWSCSSAGRAGRRVEPSSCQQHADARAPDAVARRRCVNARCGRRVFFLVRLAIPGYRGETDRASSSASEERRDSGSARSSTRRLLRGIQHGGHEGQQQRSASGAANCAQGEDPPGRRRKCPHPQEDQVPDRCVISL
jgi:hypothetical protein